MSIITWARKNSAAFYTKRLMNHEVLKNGGIDYIHNKLKRVLEAFFIGVSGFFTYDVRCENFSGDFFDLNEYDADTNSFAGIADLQKIFYLTNPEPTTVGIQFENTLSTVYSVGIRPQHGVPDWTQECIESNSRTAKKFYGVFHDTIGERVSGLTALPGADAGTEVGVVSTNLVVCVDELWEPLADANATDHTGATVWLWLLDPKTISKSVAFKSATVQYGTASGRFSRSRNYIEVALTGSSIFGVTGATIDKAELEIFYEGVTWTTKSKTDLSSDISYAFIGELTGGSPPTFSATGQNLLRPNTLDWSYDGPSGSGSGRAITGDSGAVVITNGVADATNCLELTRTNPSAAASGIKITTTGINAHGIELSGDNTDIVLDFTSSNLEIINLSGDKILQLSSPAAITGLTLSPDANGLDTIADSAGLYMGDQTSNDFGSIVTTNINGTDIKTRLTVTQGGTAVPLIDLITTEVKLLQNTDVTGTIDATGDITSSAGNIDATVGNVRALAGGVYSNGDITSATGDLILTAGDTRVAPTQDYTFSGSGQERYATIPGCAFNLGVGDGGVTDFLGIGNGQDGSIAVPVASTTQRYASAPLSSFIPNGATVTGIEAYYDMDSSDATASIKVYLNTVTNFGTGTPSLKATINFADSGAGVTNQGGEGAGGWSRTADDGVAMSSFGMTEGAASAVIVFSCLNTGMS